MGRQSRAASGRRRASGLTEDILEVGPPFPPIQDNIITLIPDADIGADTYDAEINFGVHPVAYRGGVGIRFHWLGR